MTTYSQLPLPTWQVIGADGSPAVGYLANTYLPNTTTPVTTYQDAGGISANTNPIVLDSNGMAVVYSNVAVRVILTDPSSVQVYDQVTYPPLPVTAISAAMAPVVAAGSLAEAREDLGVNAAIATAIAGIDLVPGPPGVQGVQGVQGIQGVAGPSGSGYAPQLNGNNPGSIVFPNTNSVLSFHIEMGIGTTDSTGSVVINFATPFANGVMSIQATPLIYPGAGTTCQVVNYSNAGASYTTSNDGGYFGPCNFFWEAKGY